MLLFPFLRDAPYDVQNASHFRNLRVTARFVSMTAENLRNRVEMEIRSFAIIATSIFVPLIEIGTQQHQPQEHLVEGLVA